LGGSFNPPHLAHFAMADQITKHIDVDEVWFLFSINRHKDSSKYASVKDRMAMGDILAKKYPDKKFVMSDIEDEIGTHITYDVLFALRNKFPNDRFIWVMGADNLVEFHTKWENFDKIIEEFPIVILDRPEYTEAAKKSYTALTYAYLMKDNPKDVGNADNGWTWISLDLQMSSSAIVVDLKNGKRDFGEAYQPVIDYILQHKLYGTGDETMATPTKELSTPKPP
jgi:nicotinate-nucleotide adenylyltransferase